MKINEVTKKSLKLVVEATADEVRAGLQQRLTTRDYDRTMSWVADEYNDFATQADVDRFVSDAASERDDFWQMPYARAAREAIFGLRTGAGRTDDTPTGEDPIVSLDDVTPTDGVAPGNVTPRPGGIAGGAWDQRYGATHNPDGTPKSETDRLRTQRDQSLYPDTTPSPSERDPNDPRGDQTAPPPRAETPPAEEPPAEEPPAEPVTPPTRPGQETSGANFGEITSNLRRGSRGEGVRAVQQRLGINADGIFGPATEQAVRAFQQENNLQVDGVVGRQTLAALQGGEAQQPGRIGNAPATTAPATAPATSPAPQARPVDPQAAAAVARTDNTGRRRIGTDAGDGLVWIVGNTNALTRVRPDDPRVAAQRAAVAAGGNESVSRTENSLIEGILKNAGMEKKMLNEANMNISVNGDSAAEVAELLRIMQLAGATGAKELDIHDINPKPMPTPCGAKKIGPPEPGMGDMIRMMSSEEMATEEVDDGGFEDATTEPDEYTAANAGDVSDVIPSGNDLHKEKGSYPATAGGDNPMNIKEQLIKALAEKKKCKTNKR